MCESSSGTSLGPEETGQETHRESKLTQSPSMTTTMSALPPSSWMSWKCPVRRYPQYPPHQSQSWDICLYSQLQIAFRIEEEDVDCLSRACSKQHNKKTKHGEQPTQKGDKTECVYGVSSSGVFTQAELNSSQLESLKPAQIGGEEDCRREERGSKETRGKREKRGDEEVRKRSTGRGVFFRQ